MQIIMTRSLKLFIICLFFVKYFSDCLTIDLSNHEPSTNCALVCS